MPRIANGRVVDDKPAEKRQVKNRVLTWDEFTKAPRGGAKAPNELRSRPTDEKKTTDERIPTQPPVNTVAQYLMHLLHLEDYNLSIPLENPVVRVNAVFLVLFLLFTLLLGYKMAVGVEVVSCPLDCSHARSFPSRSQIVVSSTPVSCLLNKERHSTYSLNDASSRG